MDQYMEGPLTFHSRINNLTNQIILTLRVEINAVLTDVSVLCTIIGVTELTEQTGPQLR